MEIMDSGCSTPYMTAPSSPPRLTSAAILSRFDHNPSLKDANFNFPVSSSPPSTISSPDADFAFHLAGKLSDATLSAEELFDRGKIKPFQAVRIGTESETELGDDVAFKTANSSPRRRNVFRDSFSSASSSPRKRKDVDLAPSSDDELGARRSAKREFSHRPKSEISYTTSSSSFTSTFKLTEARSELGARRAAKREFHHKHKSELGDATSFSSFDSTYKLTKARSLSPFPVSDMLFDDYEEAKQSSAKPTSKSATTSSFWTTFSLTKAYRKWKLKDLLFRSASEGRAADKVPADPALMGYAVLTKKAASGASSSSIGSSSNGSGRSRGGVPVSAHELHYTVNRAVSEEMKRKTFLPYKQSLLGCLGFNPSGHEFPGRVGSMTRV
uniref:Calmodulin-binding protein n=1 Tax=Kalanchoe fedtschenkoi TaxID=63787 RepID=A0A7N0ZVN0_KALFE